MKDPEVAKNFENSTFDAFSLSLRCLLMAAINKIRDIWISLFIKILQVEQQVQKYPLQGPQDTASWDRGQRWAWW